MNKKDAIGILLSRDEISYSDMISYLSKDEGRVLFSSPDGMIVCYGDLIASVAVFSSWERIVQSIPLSFPTLCVHDEELRNHFVGKNGYHNETGCSTYLWRKGDVDLSGYDFRVLDLSYLPKIRSVYTLVDESDLRKDIAAGRVCGLFVSGSLVGFVGLHYEGGMGMLHVFSEYRRKGYGEMLELCDIDFALRKGELPYCHVFSSNAPSMALQEKLGLEKGMKNIWWLVRKEIYL